MAAETAAQTPQKEVVATQGAFLIHTVAQNYEWGRNAQESEACVRPSELLSPWRQLLNIQIKVLSLGNASNSRFQPLCLQVARLTEAGGGAVDPAKPYAELW